MACGCCPRSGYDELFSERQARRDARRYRRKGLDKAARWIVDAVCAQGVEGATVLEPGGGVGAIQIELLKAGAARSAIVELSRRYEEVAAELASEARVAERIERRLGDFAAEENGQADVVVLHRVVCCYPDYERLLSRAADRAGRVLVFTYPPRNFASRALLAVLNVWMAARGRAFRAFAHPPQALVAVVAERGLEPYARRRALVWQGVAFRRR
ncbi:MAG: SAM-dependent methyltransferase [Thermoleophilia bacterium]